MTMGSKFATAIVLAIAVSGGVAQAEQNDQTAETAAVSGATITASEAIASAEKQGKGKVVELTLEGRGTAVVYVITLMDTDGTETNFTVDGKTGAVVETGEAADQGDGDGETRDDNGQGDGSGGDGDGETND
jgi:uncharacterized membrane protein YkoI